MDGDKGREGVTQLLHAETRIYLPYRPAVSLPSAPLHFQATPTPLKSRPPLHPDLGPPSVMPLQRGRRGVVEGQEEGEGEEVSSS